MKQYRVLWGFRKMGGTPRSSISRLVIPYKPSIHRGTPHIWKAPYCGWASEILHHQFANLGWLKPYKQWDDHRSHLVISPPSTVHTETNSQLRSLRGSQAGAQSSCNAQRHAPYLGNILRPWMVFCVFGGWKMLILR